MNSPASGTVTFLFTDIEGSTKLAREHTETWEKSRARHHQILRGAIESNAGFVFQIIGDAFCAAFHKAGDALKAAVESQQALQNESWGDCVIRVRMGIHTGEAELHNNEYQGYLTLSLVQRIMSAGHGGQILISNVTENLLRGQLPKDISLRDMGEHKLKDVPYLVRVFQVMAPDLQTEFPALRALNLFPNNLPSQLTSFIGREQEIKEIKQFISTHRLVTLTGVGGTGKTRLSLQVAADLLDQFPNGVWFVELAGLSDPEFIPQAILTSLGLPEQPGLTILQLLEDYLRDKKTLLVLDNCEHLIQGCAGIVRALLSKSSSLNIITSSREPLGITGELIWHVPSLALPPIEQFPTVVQLTQYESVQLFMERATLVQPSFEVTRENAPAIAQICVRLDGIPLAIELAAARVRALSVDQIAKRLDDRFRLLTGGSRAALERHQTLRAAVDWSYNLLTPDEHLLFRRLSVFIGGWTLEAAEQVCTGSNDISSGEVLELLTQLVDKSLIVLDGSRYHMLETTRQYAREKLFESGEGEILRDRNLAFYANLADQSAPKLHTSERVRWIEELRTESDNFRGALEWSLSDSKEHNAEKALRLASALPQFWQSDGYYQEGRAWLEKALAMHLDDSSESVLLRARAFYAAGNLAWFQGDYPYALYQLEKSVELYRRTELTDKRDLSAALNMLAITRANDNLTLARSLIDESVAICRSLGSADGWDLALALFWDAEIASRQRDFEIARKRAEESLAIFRQVGDLFQSAGPLYVLAGITFTKDDYETARAYYQECLQIWHEAGNRWGVALVKNVLGTIDLFMGEYAAATVHFEESLTQWLEIRVTNLESVEPHVLLGITMIHQEHYDRAAALLLNSLTMFSPAQDKSLVALTLAALSVIAVTQKQLARGARLLGAAETIVTSMNVLEAMDNVRRTEYEFLVAKAYSHLDKVVARAALTDGRMMTIEQAVVFALEQSNGK